MVTEDDVRRVALSMPAVVEKPYNRLASFRVGRNLFIRVHELPDTVFVRCANLGEMTELVIESWRICAPTRLLAAYDLEHPPPS